MYHSHGGTIPQGKSLPPHGCFAPTVCLETGEGKCVRSECVRIFRMKRVSIPLALTAAGHLALLLYLGYGFALHPDPLSLLNNSLTLHGVLAVVLLYTSFEITYDSRHSGCEETVSVERFGRLRFFSEPIAVQMIFLGGLFCVLVAVPSVAGGVAHMPLGYFAHVLWVNVLNTLLAGAVLILTGSFLALGLNRIKAYIVMALMIFLIVPFSDSLPGILNDAFAINLWPVKAFFSRILPPNLNWDIDYQYGVSCEPLRWNLVLFWLCLIAAAWAGFLWKRKPVLRNGLAGICVVLAGINLFFYLQGGSLLDLSESPTSVFRSDQVYYNHSAQKEEEPGFSIASYDMDLRVDRRLHGDVVMRLDASSGRKEYPFTLFRGLDISAVTDEAGRDLPFTRSGDYFTVSPTREIRAISVRYSGVSPVFYSNEQAVCLPGCFPYYPWAGYRKIYFLEPDDDIGFPAYVTRTDLPVADFSVRISGVRNLQTNLPGGSGVYGGKTNGLSVLGGFIASRALGPYRVIEETMNDEFSVSWLDELQSAVTARENRLGITEHIRLTDYDIVRFPQIMQYAGYDDAVLMSDHLFLNPVVEVDLLAREMVRQKNEPVLLTSEDYFTERDAFVAEREGRADGI